MILCKYFAKQKYFHKYCFCHTVCKLFRYAHALAVHYTSIFFATSGSKAGIPKFLDFNIQKQFLGQKLTLCLYNTC